MKTDIKNEIIREPVICTVIAMLFAMIPCAVVICFRIRDIAGILHAFAFFFPFWLSLFFALPFILTAYNILYLVCPNPSAEIRTAGHGMELLTVVLGFIYSYLWVFVEFTPISFAVDWYEDSDYLGTPLAKEAFPTVLMCIVIAVVGYGVLRYFGKCPIPVTILCFGAMYVGIALCALWIFQVIGKDPMLCLAPFNFILIAAKTVKETIIAERTLNREKEDVQFWEKGIHWLWIAAAVAVLLFAAVILIMLLFGQPSDSLIRAWTDTRGYPLSLR